MSKTVLILNKFSPYDNAITGKSAADLGMVLQQSGLTVTFICIDGSYKKIGTARPDDGTFKIKSLRRRSMGTSGVGRLLTSLCDGWRMSVVAKRTPADTIICMTDPPLLNIWGGWLKRKTKRKVIFWTMDLYPDAFVAGGLVKPTSYLFKKLHEYVYGHPPDALIALGHQQLEYLNNQYGLALPSVVLPCGIQKIEPSTQPPLWMRSEDSGKIKFCYAGNLGEAHDENFLVDFARALNPDTHRLYVNIYGSRADKILPVLERLPAVQTIDFLSYDQMHYLDIHLATLVGNWDHVCVPSKAVSAICTGAVLLLNTSTRCDGWDMFKDAAWLIEWRPGANFKADIAAFLQTIDRGQISTKQRHAMALGQALQETRLRAYREISALCAG